MDIHQKRRTIVFSAVVVFLIIVVAVITIIYLAVGTKTAFGFTSRDAAVIQAIINKYGGIENIRYDEFIREYPNGNNIIYMKLKRYSNPTMGDIENILN
jgi:hypothetical protein